ncbi:phage tail protein [Undibacterium sp.]|uniref:phage tail protein n=1 Tax=Undibacterium sp. TaxID=1914977 RepID=UPI00273164D1|nr:phage tail protein [Undibacterium sp.]MDP1976263.1 phage tail protein [Undibacterium sp.]
MSARDLKLQVIFNMIERVTAPLKRIMAQSSASGKALKALRDRLKEMDAQQKNITGFRRMSASLRETSGRLGAAQQKVKALAEQMRATQHPTRAMTREFDRATRAARLIKEQLQRESQQLQVLRSSLHAAGISTQQLSAHERTLRNNMAATNAQIAAQQQQLAGLARRQQQVAAARQRMDSTRNAASNAKMTGFDMAMTGAVMGMPMIKSLNESKHFETEMNRIVALGMGDKISADAIKFSQGMKTYGVSSLESMELMRDSLTVFADLHHAEMVLPTLAKMKFANAAMFGEEAGAERGQTFMNMLKVIELRGGLASKERFIHEANLVQKVITATGGRVGPNEWLNFIKTGGVAAKSMKDEAFFYKMEPLIQEMGGHRVGTGLMSAYSNLYQGRTTVRAAQEMGRLDLLDTSKVQYNKIGMIKQIKPGALAGGDLLKSDPMAWLETVLLPKLAAKGITDQEQIKDTIATIMTNRTASNLFTQMYLQRAQIHKNAKLNAGAANIDTLDKVAKTTAKGKELETLARIRNTEKEIGEQVLPIYAAALQKLASALQSVTTFMKEHSTTAKVVVVGFTALAATMVVMGGITIVLASIIGPLALLRFGFAMLGIRGALLAGTFARLGAAFARIGPFIARIGVWLRGLLPALRLVGTAVMWLGRAFLVAGRFLLMNPIGLAITAIAAAAYLIYRNWAQVSAFFSSLWASIKTSFNSGIAALSAFIQGWHPVEKFRSMMAAVYGYFTIDLPAKFSEFGSNMMQGLVNGITSAAGTVRDTISSMADNVVSWFKEKLGIHSPSVVFAELGQFTMQGLSIGIEKAQALPLDKLNGVTRQMTAMGAGMAFSAAINPAFAQLPPVPFNPQQAVLVQFAAQRQEPPRLAEPIKFDRRPPVQAQGSSAVSVGNNPAPAPSNIQIVINPPAGMDPQAIAKAVAAELDRRERQQSQQRRSAMHDYDES